MAIGDELLSGETVDTNSSWLDAELEKWGYAVQRHVTVADEPEAISDAYREGAARCDLLISTGGLGPTDDDLTLSALATALDCELVRNAAVLDAIAKKFASFGRTMTPNNERQADVPASGEVLMNDVGTAPGFTAQLGRANIFVLPGVPSEVRWLFEHRVAPRLGSPAPQWLRRTLRVVGLGESRLEHQIREIVQRHPHVRFGYRALGLENHIKLRSDASAGRSALDDAEAAVREVLGPRVFGVDGTTLTEATADALGAAGRSVAVAESCTGGSIQTALTDEPGSSRYYLGGAVVYADSAKAEILGVDSNLIQQHGAVSPEVAGAMAQGVRERFGAELAVATTGIAGPSGGSEEKPVGLVYIALADGASTVIRRRQFLKGRGMVRGATTVFALDWLRRRALGLPDPDAS